MQSIIDKRGNNPRKGTCIFSFMEVGDDTWEYEEKKKNFTKHINDRMKVIGEKLNIGKITTCMKRYCGFSVSLNFQ